MALLGTMGLIASIRTDKFGQYDINPLIGLAVICMVLALLSPLAVQMLKRGYKLRH